MSIFTAVVVMFALLAPSTRPVEEAGPLAVPMDAFELDGFEVGEHAGRFGPRRVVATAEREDATATYEFDRGAGTYSLVLGGLGAGDGRGRLKLMLNATKLLDVAPDSVAVAWVPAANVRLEPGDRLTVIADRPGVKFWQLLVKPGDSDGNLFTAGGPYAFVDHPLEHYLLGNGLETAERLKFERGGDLLSLSPAVLPEATNVVGGHDTFSRPVGARLADGTLLLNYMTRRYHWGGEGPARDGQTNSYTNLHRSTDGGRTWGRRRSLEHELQGGPSPEHANTGNGAVFFVPANAGFDVPGFGGDVSREVVLVTSSGVYASHDGGQTWELYADALTDSQMPTNVNFSRQPLYHPEHGLVFFGHTSGDDKDIDPRMFVHASRDGGRTWTQATYDPGTPGTAKFIEPTAVHHDGRLAFVSRNMDTATNLPILAGSDGGWFPLDFVRVHDFGVPTIGDGTHPDTPDLIFNPVTKRYEALLVNRFGGGPDDAKAAVKSLLLYSIDPDDFHGGDPAAWRYEGCLFRQRNAHDRADGLQACGTAVDVDRGVQHVWMMVGDLRDKAGVFQLTRTLDTPALAEYLGRNAELADTPR